MGFTIENGVLKDYTEELGVTEVAIPDSVTRIGGYAFYRCTSLTSVAIPDSVTSIGESAFEDCTSLTSVTIPDSVTSIGESAFRDCTSLTSVTIPDSVTSIGGEAFQGCSSLTSVTIPDSVTSIGWHTFEDCTSLTTVTIPDSVTKIESKAFYRCTGLTSVTIPESVTSIGDRAFEECSSLTSVTIPDSVTSIGRNAFYYCKSLTSVTFPDSVIYIHDAAFSGTPFCKKDKRECVIYGKTLYKCRGQSQNITIPDSVASIGDEAFRRCTSLTTIVFDGDIPEYDKYTFEKCPISALILKKVPIKDWKDKGALRKPNAALGFMIAYEDGFKFTEEVIPANRKWIQTNRSKLWDLVIGEPKAIKYLADEKILTYDEAQILVEKATGNVECISMLLEYINTNFNAEEIIQSESDKMDKAFGIKDYTLAEYKKMFGLKDDGNGGYIITKYDHDEVYITIPEKINGKTVTAIGGFAFSPDQQKLTPKQREQRRQIVSVMLPDSVIAIGEYAFKHCEKLEDITTSATNVGKGAFLKCTGKVTRKLKEKYPDAFEGDILVGMTFVITGALKKYTRDQAKEEIEKRGGKLSGSASANACYIVTNHPKRMTEKLIKAKEEGVPVISEVEFLKMLK